MGPSASVPQTDKIDENSGRMRLIQQHLDTKVVHFRQDNDTDAMSAPKEAPHRVTSWLCAPLCCEGQRRPQSHPSPLIVPPPLLREEPSPLKAVFVHSEVRDQCGLPQIALGAPTLQTRTKSVGSIVTFGSDRQPSAELLGDSDFRLSRLAS